MEKSEFDYKMQEKDAEIERLNEALKDVSDHGCALERMQFINAQSSEIERLRNVLQRNELYMKDLAERAANALDSYHPEPDFPKLIRELRQAGAQLLQQ